MAPMAAKTTRARGMNTLIAIAIGGAMGAVSRYGLNSIITAKVTTSIPVGILSINFLGSLLMGIALALFVHLWDGSQTLKAFVMIGFLGSFTTFSTFSLESFQLIERHAYVEAAIYVFGSVLLSIGGLFLGLFLTKQIIL